jgi:hypothetical protein
MLVSAHDAILWVMKGIALRTSFCEGDLEGIALRKPPSRETWRASPPAHLITGGLEGIALQ